MHAIEVLWQDAVALFHDRVTLVGLEAQRAWRSLLVSFALSICAALFVVIGAIAAVAALAVWLWLAGLSIVSVILIAAGTSALCAMLCFWIIAKNISAISFSASLRSITSKKAQYESNPKN